MNALETESLLALAKEEYLGFYAVVVNHKVILTNTFIRALVRSVSDTLTSRRFKRTRNVQREKFAVTRTSSLDLADSKN